MAKKKEAKTPNGTLKKAAGIAATVIVVVGVAVVAYMARQPQAPMSESKTQKTAANDVLESKIPSLLVVDPDGPRLADLSDGRIIQLSWPNDVSRLGKPLSQVQGADGRSGGPVWLDPEFKLVSSTAVRAPDGRRTAWLGSDKRDGGSGVLVQMGRETNSYALRSRNGKKISGVQLIGWVSPQEVAFVGAATDTRWIYLLDMDGSVSQLAPLPEQAWLFRVADGLVYYATAQPGEGLEAPQTPPSAIWRVGLGGKQEKIADEPNAVIQAFVAAKGRVYYSLDNGDLKFVRDGLVRNVGQGLPVLDLGTAGVLVRKDDSLHVATEDGATRAVSYASVDSLVFYLESADMHASSTESVN